MGKWWQFTKERFDPLSHSLMMALFILAHFAVAELGGRVNFATLTGNVSLPLAQPQLPAAMKIVLAIGVVAFFFKLRLYDEIKDYELDCVINPTRPLARGLVTHSDLYKGIGLCIAVELMTFGVLGKTAFISMGIAILYSLLMYKEFFIKDIIRPHLTTYALMHTIVLTMLSSAIFAAIMQVYSWQLSKDMLFFALNCWCLFNIFEFGRKTFNSDEERENVESYSNIFGRYGAFLLVLSQAVAQALLLFNTSLVSGTAFFYTMASFVILLILIGLLYAVLDRKPFGKIYRGMSSVYIVLVFGAIVGFHLAGKL
jgi:4-hydroxybenzoate polyprenyltransferase